MKVFFIIRGLIVKTKTCFFKDQIKKLMIIALAMFMVWVPALLRADGTYVAAHHVRPGVNYSSGYGYHSGHHKSYQHRVNHGYRPYSSSRCKHGFNRGHKGYAYKSYDGHRYGHRRYYSGHAQPGNRNYYSSGDVAAAAIIGGMIGYGVSYYQNRQRYYEPYHTARGYAYKVYPVSVKTGENSQETIVLPPKKRLKELDGSCYEIARNQFGDELKIQLQDWNCNW